jgi:hypothetical protein
MARQHFSLLKPSEGGISFSDAKFKLSEAGVTDVKQEYSPYIGNYGLSVPKEQAEKAETVLFA